MRTGGILRRRVTIPLVALMAILASFVVTTGTSSGDHDGHAVHLPIGQLFSLHQVNADGTGINAGFDHEGSILVGYFSTTTAAMDPTQVATVFRYEIGAAPTDGCNGATRMLVIGVDINGQWTAGWYELTSCAGTGMTHLSDLEVRVHLVQPGLWAVYAQMPESTASEPFNVVARACANANTACSAGSVLNIDFDDIFTAALLCYGRPVTVFGSVHDDEVQATAANEVIRTFGGNDIVNADDGDDVICLDEGDDVGHGEAGDDTIYGDAELVQLPGDDIITGGPGDDEVFAGTGDDDVKGNAGKDTLRGEGGTDTLVGGGGNDEIFGGPGADTATGGGGKDTITGGGGKDTLNGNRGADEISGGGGSDVVNGNGGADTLSGGGGRDTVNGGGGKDDISGNGGRDKLNGGGGSGDQVKGGAGRDTLSGGGGGNDSCNGGGGTDTLKSSHGCETVTNVP